MPFIENHTFENTNFSDTPLKATEYDNCTFINCSFSNIDLSNLVFVDCLFEQCDLSMAILTNTGLKTVNFIDCKLIGIAFNDCNPFLLALEFKNCTLHLASFYKLKLKNTLFDHCDLKEVDFTASDMTGTTFNHCNLAQATFENTIVEKVDFRTASNYSFDLEINRIKKAKFSKSGLEGLLSKYDIIISP